MLLTIIKSVLSRKEGKRVTLNVVSCPANNQITANEALESRRSSAMAPGNLESRELGIEEECVCMCVF